MKTLKHIFGILKITLIVLFYHAAFFLWAYSIELYLLAAIPVLIDIQLLRLTFEEQIDKALKHLPSINPFMILMGIAWTWHPATIILELIEEDFNMITPLMFIYCALMIPTGIAFIFTGLAGKGMGEHSRFYKKI